MFKSLGVERELPHKGTERSALLLHTSQVSLRHGYLTTFATPVLNLFTELSLPIDMAEALPAPQDHTSAKASLRRPAFQNYIY